MYLSVAVNWVFIIQDKSEIVQVFSNVTESSIVNESVRALLSEVLYKREESGFIRAIQPYRTRHNDARPLLLDVVSTALLDLSGNPISIAGDRSSITLHFTREGCQNFM